MLKTVKTKSGKTVVAEQFSSIHEFINTVKSRTLNSWVNDAVRNGARDGEAWVGKITYPQALELIQTGWDKPLKQFSEAIKKLDSKKLKDAKKPIFFKSVAGFKPIVPNALKGLPKSMVGKKLVTKKSKIVNVMIEISKPARYSHDEIVEKSIEILSELYNLERKGFRVRLSMIGTHAQAHDKTQFGWTLTIKHENQPFDIKKLMFPLVHSAMLRMLSFDWFESVPGGEKIAGYGQAVYGWSSDESRKEYLDVFGNMENYYFIGHGTLVKGLFTNVK